MPTKDFTTNSISIEDFIIKTYVHIDDFLKSFDRLRKRGPSPALTDAEVITMEIVGEFLSLGSDKKIYEYFKNHWKSWFPKLGTRVTFVRQSANLLYVKTLLQTKISKELLGDQDIFLFDGFPIPTINLTRLRRKNVFWGDGAVGYCAAKDHKYFGFKGHILTDRRGLVVNFNLTAANIDERDVLPELVEGKRGFVIADKGLICKKLQENLLQQDINLQTPLKNNMKDSRPKSYIKSIMNARRMVETVIGQLVDRFKIQSIRAKDLFHLSVKTTRKILAHTFAFLFAGSLEFDQILS
jgi:IS5 family transposase